MVPALHSEESMGQLRSKSGTGKHFVYIPGNGAKRQLISVRVDVHYQRTGGYRSPRAGFCQGMNTQLGLHRPIPCDFAILPWSIIHFDDIQCHLKPSMASCPRSDVGSLMAYAFQNSTAFVFTENRLLKFARYNGTWNPCVVSTFVLLHATWLTDRYGRS